MTGRHEKDMGMKQGEGPRRLPFASDYERGALPQVLDRLRETNLEPNPGYGTDAHSGRARDLIRAAADAPEAEVSFLAGGTQTNAVVIDALLAPWQGVVAADSGHVSVHEAGAIEAMGHKVIELAGTDSKLTAGAVDAACAEWESDENREHMVMPGLVYVSQPTEYGRLYTLAELEALRAACDGHGIGLYVDGARLAYALAAPGNDVGLADLARLADAFYVGGTKCGTLLGEAVVLPRPGTCPHLLTQVKRRGALLAKGFVVGAQFEALFEDGLYQRLGARADAQAACVASAFEEAGCELLEPQETNQVIVALAPAQLERLEARVESSFWSHLADGRTAVRLATSWSSTDEEVDALVDVIRTLA
jgi:threonine aldolase